LTGIDIWFRLAGAVYLQTALANSAESVGVVGCLFAKTNTPRRVLVQFSSGWTTHAPIGDSTILVSFVAFAFATVFFVVRIGPAGRAALARGLVYYITTQSVQASLDAVFIILTTIAGIIVCRKSYALLNSRNRPRISARHHLDWRAGRAAVIVS
jgi:hypothetical protein